MLQYKSFSFSLFTNQLERLLQETSRNTAVGIGAGATVLIAGALLGGLDQQIRSLINGRDLENMQNPKFWAQALARGGAVGPYGEILLHDWNRFGASAGSFFQGPTLGFVGDTAKGVSALVTKGDAGPLVALTSKNVPVISSHWATRLAYERLVVDQLQEMLDPRAFQKFQRQEQKLMKEKGQGFWWRRGELSPSREPKFSTAFP